MSGKAERSARRSVRSARGGRITMCKENKKLKEQIWWIRTGAALIVVFSLVFTMLKQPIGLDIFRGSSLLLVAIGSALFVTGMFKSNG